MFVVEGADASPAEDATPAATTEEGGSFSVTFTAEAGDIGEHTVWAFIPGSECGDSVSPVDPRIQASAGGGDPPLARHPGASRVAV